VVQAPLVVEANVSRVDRRLDIGRELRQAWSRILNLVECRRKSPKVVNGPRVFHRSHLSASRLPMCRHHQDRLGYLDLSGHVSESSDKLILLDGIHRAAVSQEKDGHLWGVFQRAEDGF